MGEWQDIASAPKDGTTILLGAWYQDDCNGYYGDSCWKWIASGSIDEEGIWIDIEDDHIASAGFHKVTHWMPLPAPLVETGG